MQLNQTSIRYYDKRLSRLSTCTEATDAIVPDAFPDIGRVVCAYGTVSIKDQTPQNGRFLVSGSVQTAVLYEPEGGGELRRLSIPVSFAHIEEGEGLEPETVCAVACHAAAVDAVAVNSRKLNVSVQLCFSIEGYCPAVCEITEGVDLPQIELLTAPQSITLVEQAKSYPITVLDDVQLQDALGLSLLHTMCTMRAAECRAMHGKIVLKGEASLQCLALQEDGAVRVLTSSSPFTQILELPEAEEGDAAAARLTVRDVDCRIDADGLLSYTVSGAALVTLRRTRAVQQIRDLYLPGKTLRIQEEKAALRSLPPPLPFSAETTETLQTAQHVSHVVSAMASCCSVKRSEEELQLTVAVQVLYLGDDQQLCVLQRVLPMTMSCAVAGTPAQLSLTARASAAGEQGLLLTVSATGQAAAEQLCVFRHLTALETVDRAQDDSGVTLVLRYIDQEQALWDIAKACGTTMDAIRRANELAADAVDVSHTMLLIPIQG
ncbi:MAG: DUF3794 domain-containing protein [Eubacteriales bacterium]|nr:DUF3794 domain-containing protein [Eubacteriales bacterium]